MVIRAVATTINESNIDLGLVDDLKIGDGEITLEYYVENAERYYIPVGFITVYSNGKIFVSIDNEEYMSIIYNDYIKIKGGDIAQVPIGLDKIPIDSYDCDKSRWDRIKKFIADNNIELKYSEDINMDNAEHLKMTYEDYLERNQEMLNELKDDFLTR